MNLDSFPRRGESDILAQTAADDLVLLNLKSGEYFALDEVGNRIWDLSDGTRSVTEIIAVICREYDAPPEVIEADTLELLKELADEGLVTEAK